MSELKIYGAGLAGLITAHVLRSHAPRIIERQPTLPNNHAALLRFRSEAVAEATGIDFTRVRVHKAIKHDGAIHTRSNLRLANLYARKVIGYAHPRSVIDLSPVDRWIAPSNFVQLLADSLPDRISFGHAGLSGHILESADRAPIVSTIPMPKLMTMVRWPEPPAFISRSITTITVALGSAFGLHQTIYYPDAGSIPYRCSITGSTLIIEMITESPDRGALAAHLSDVSDLRDPVYKKIIQAARADFGLGDYPADYRVKTTEFGKILPLDRQGDQTRKDFIMAMTDLRQCYSVGRFATWRQILLDDIVNDARHVKRMIEGRHGYAERLGRRS